MKRLHEAFFISLFTIFINFHQILCAFTLSRHFYTASKTRECNYQEQRIFPISEIKRRELKKKIRER